MVADSPHILLVEDNVIALHLIETIVTQAGLRFTSATDGAQALTLAKSVYFDLIITDIGLPGLSGFELAEAVREWEKITLKNPIPIVGLTAYTLHEIEEQCLQAGINKMLSNPVSLKTIHELTNQFIFN